MLDSNRTDFILPGSVDWSPDGKEVAFWVSFDAVRRDGSARSEGEWLLYTMDPMSLQTIKRMEGIYHPYGLRWSPDSEWLAFFGQTDPNGPISLWVYSTSNNTQTMIAPADSKYTGDPVWSVDGQQLAVLRSDVQEQMSEIRIFDVSKVIGTAP